MIGQSNGTATAQLPPQVSDVHAEYVFSVKEMKHLLRKAGDNDIISIKVRFEADKRAGRRRVFRARITARVEASCGDQSGEQRAPEMRVLNYEPSSKEIEGCPRPPSCSI